MEQKEIVDLITMNEFLDSLKDIIKSFKVSLDDLNKRFDTLETSLSTLKHKGDVLKEEIIENRNYVTASLNQMDKRFNAILYNMEAIEVKTQGIKEEIFKKMEIEGAEDKFNEDEKLKEYEITKDDLKPDLPDINELNGMPIKPDIEVKTKETKTTKTKSKSKKSHKK